MNSSSWYHSLKKPAWAPQEQVFGAVWSILYPIIFAVNIYVLFAFTSSTISLAIALPFWLNLFFNILYTPLQFGLRNNALALIDIMLVLITIIWAIIMIWQTAVLAAIAFVPYLVWVAIATTLQAYITLHNK